jgi:hypothetical protein
LPRFNLFHNLENNSLHVIKSIQDVAKDKTFYADNLPKDTIKTYYLDSLYNKKFCLLLSSKIKTRKELNLYRGIQIIDSLGKTIILLPNQIAGYWVKGLFYKSFKIIYKNKKVCFFAQEIVTGKASIYLYNGELLTNESIYIFKKQWETEYIFVQEKITSKTNVSTSNTVQNSDGSVSGSDILSFFDEEPYLNYFQSYFTDCKDVLLKFQSKWYEYLNLSKVFTDYNNCK